MHDVFYSFLDLPPNSPFRTMSRAMLIKALTKQIFKISLFEYILPRVLFSFNLCSYLLIPLQKVWENWRSSVHLFWTNTCSVKLKFCYSCIRHLSGMNRCIKLSTSTCSCEYIILSSKTHFNLQNLCYEINRELTGICTRVSRICRRCVMSWKKAVK